MQGCRRFNEHIENIFTIVPATTMVDAYHLVFSLDMAEASDFSDRINVKITKQSGGHIK